MCLKIILNELEMDTTYISNKIIVKVSLED